MATSVATLPPFEAHIPNIYRLVYVAIIVYVLICFFGPITGAHLNPAVTLAAYL
jgi:glycerol uptake facilitator-like aquaporin